MRSLVTQLAVHGETDERSLKNITESIRKDLLELPEVSLIETLYMRADEISVEVSEATLRRHQLTLDQVAQAIRSSSIDIPGGSVKADAGEFAYAARGSDTPARNSKTLS